MASTPVSGIDHIGIVVRDIDASVSYYTDQLGFTLLSDELTAASGGARLVYLDAGNIILQLVSPLATGPIADYLNNHGEGLHHICLTVPDIDDTIAALAPDSTVPVVVGGRGRRTTFLPDQPNNLVTELTEPGPPRSAPSIESA